MSDPTIPRSHWNRDEDVDEAEVESFPASDPPAYTLGIEAEEPSEPDS